jgi:dienelactone hydrolase
MAVPDKVSATIMYYPYGKLVSDRQKLQGVTRPVQAHFAEHDFFLTPEKQQQFTSLLKNSGVNLSINIYDARHGFDNPASKNFDHAEQKVSWSRSSAFLTENLKRD